MRLRPLVSVLLLLFSAQAPERLSAQIRMPRPKLPNPLSRVVPSSTPAPEYDDRVLEITDARINALLRGLRAEEERRPALEAAYKKNADDRAAAQVAQRRQSQQINDAQTCLTNSPEFRAIYGDTAAQRRVARRIEAARERGDQAMVKRLEDSTAMAMMPVDPNVAMGLITAQQRCAGNPALYAAPTGPAPAPEIQTRLPDSLRIIGIGASGLTEDQYAVLRERALAFLWIDDAERRNPSYAFGSGELSALQSRRNDLVRYQEALATR